MPSQILARLFIPNHIPYNPTPRLGDTMAPATKPVVVYAEQRTPPFAVLAAARLAGIDVDTKVEPALAKSGTDCCLRLPSGCATFGWWRGRFDRHCSGSCAP